jgi:hypothetical protein
MTSIILQDLKLKNNMTFMELLSQCQDYCPKILCLIKNKQGEEKLQIYKKREQIPKNLIYQHCLNDCYYFKDAELSYVVFGLSAAQIFFPALNQDVVETKPQKMNCHFLKPIDPYLPNQIILYTHDKKYTFPISHNQFIMKQINLF